MFPGRVIMAGAVVVASLATVLAQEGLTEASFEAATIKRNVTGAENWALNPRASGQFTVINGRVADIVKAAFLAQDDEIDGLPDWTRNERYDVVAKLDLALATHDQPAGYHPTWALALRSLLVERLRLAFHRETRQKPVYALVRATRDGALGPNLKPAAVDCEALRQQAVTATRQGGPSPYPPTTDDRIVCGSRISDGRILYGGNTLDEFRGILSRRVGRAVLDRANLEGKWDFVLTFAPNPVGRNGEPGDAPDLFTALVEQLGLRLESTTGPVEVLVVDRIERPTSD